MHLSPPLASRAGSASLLSLLASMVGKCLSKSKLPSKALALSSIFLQRGGGVHDHPISNPFFSAKTAIVKEML